MRLESLSPTPLVLIDRGHCHHTVKFLRQALLDAESGDLVGAACALMYREKGYTVETAGEAHRSPTYSRGMLRALDDKLSRRIWRRKDE